LEIHRLQQTLVLVRKFIVWLPDHISELSTSHTASKEDEDEIEVGKVIGNENGNEVAWMAWWHIA